MAGLNLLKKLLFLLVFHTKACLRLHVIVFLDIFIVIINCNYHFVNGNVIIVKVVTNCSLFTKKFYYNFVVFFEDVYVKYSLTTLCCASFNFLSLINFLAGLFHKVKRNSMVV